MRRYDRAMEHVQALSGTNKRRSQDGYAGAHCGGRSGDCQPRVCAPGRAGAGKHPPSVLDALQRREDMAARHFAPTTGYGYDDIGRDALEARVCPDLFGMPTAAIVRPSDRVRAPHALFPVPVRAAAGPGERAAFRLRTAPMTRMENRDRRAGRCPAGSAAAKWAWSYAEVAMERGSDGPGRLRRRFPRHAAVHPGGGSSQRSRGYAWRAPACVPEDVAPLVGGGACRDGPDAVRDGG